MKQAGMFEMDNRTGKIDCNGDPLVKLNEVIGWEMFRSKLEGIRQKARNRPLKVSLYQVRCL